MYKIGLDVHHRNKVRRLELGFSESNIVNPGTARINVFMHGGIIKKRHISFVNLPLALNNQGNHSADIQ